MDRVESLIQYQSLYREIHKEYHKTLTNNYMFPQQIQRYIDLKRFYYEKVTAGGIFYTDEETHYKAYYILQPDISFSLERKEKPIYMRNVYIEEKKSEGLLKIEKMLAASGMKKMNVTTYVTVNPEEGLKKLRKVYKGAITLLEDNGFTLMQLPADRVDEFIFMQQSLEMIPYYELSYHTPEEYRQEIEMGHIWCIMDQSGALCALKHHYEESNALSGWIYVKPEYQKVYGMAIVLTYAGLEYAVKHNIHKGYGWVLIDNYDSIRYHKKLGYQWTNRVSDEWLLESIE